MRSKFKWIFTLLLALTVQFSFAQEKTITGVVSDANGPLPGVNVVVKGTQRGVSTGFDGSYSIRAKEGETLVYSFMGMRDISKIVGASNVINTILQDDSKQLTEVVVVAYGTQKKSNVTGSIAKIKSESIEKRPLTNLSSAIEGATAGVIVTSGSGQPGSGQDIRIRGFGSVGGSNSPLYVVDGIPINGDLSGINPQDIDNISILKDAGSTALYGNKASNGVVLVTTKKGKSAKGSIRMNVGTGVVTRGNQEYDRLNPFQYYEVFWDARRNGLLYALTNPQTPAQAAQNATNDIFGLLQSNPFNVANNQIVGLDGKINPNAQLIYRSADLDWQKSIQRVGLIKTADLSFDGKTEKGDFYASLSYLDQEGYIINSDFNRVSGRLNASNNVLKWLKTGVNIGANLSRGNQAQANDDTNASFVNPFRFTRTMGPIYPIYELDANGDYILDSNGQKIYAIDTRPSGANSGRHILAETKLNRDRDERNSFNGKAFFELTLAKGLKLTNNLSYEIENLNNSVFWNPLVGDGQPSGYAAKTNDRITTVAYNQLLNYNFKLSDLHNFDVLVGHESQEFKFQRLFADKRGLIFEGNTELDNFSQNASISSYTDSFSEESFFSRLNYEFSDRYNLSLSARRDGSSRFSEDNRWGNFWGAGLAWNVSNESFLKDATSVNELKLRASYGELGNNRGIGYYPYKDLAGLGYNNQAEPGVVISNLGAKDLKWEKSKHLDVALDFGFFNRLRGTVGYYHKESSDLIFNVPLPLSNGGTVYGDDIPKNIGNMVNKGFEVEINYDLFKKQDFKWTVTLNASTLKNEITKLPPGQDVIPQGTKQLKVGRSLYDYYIRDWYGVDPADGAGLFVAQDPNATGVRIINGVAVTPNSNNAKFVYAGSVIPDYFGSFSSNLKYKNFGLDIMTTYQIGGKNLDTNYQSLMNTSSYGAALHVDNLDRWQQPGDVTSVPRADATMGGQWAATSDRFLVDASFFSLRQVNLYYDFPKLLTDKIDASNVRIFVNGENLFNINARKGFVQQQSFTGNTSNNYIPSRVVTLGVNFKF